MEKEERKSFVEWLSYLKIKSFYNSNVSDKVVCGYCKSIYSLEECEAHLKDCSDNIEKVRSFRRISG